MIMFFVLCWPLFFLVEKEVKNLGLFIKNMHTIFFSSLELEGDLPINKYDNPTIPRT